MGPSIEDAPDSTTVRLPAGETISDIVGEVFGIFSGHGSGIIKAMISPTEVCDYVELVLKIRACVSYAHKTMVLIKKKLRDFFVLTIRKTILNQTVQARIQEEAANRAIKPALALAAVFLIGFVAVTSAIYVPRHSPSLS